MGTKGLRNGAIFTFFVSMGILLIGGHFAKGRIPPIPQKAVRGETALTDRACGRSLKQYGTLANCLANHFGVSRAVLLDA